MDKFGEYNDTNQGAQNQKSKKAHVLGYSSPTL